MGDRLPRKLAAVLYADVVGYSHLTGEDEDATHRTLSEYLDLVSTTIVSHQGQVSEKLHSPCYSLLRGFCVTNSLTTGDSSAANWLSVASSMLGFRATHRRT